MNQDNLCYANIGDLSYISQRMGFKEEMEQSSLSLIFDQISVFSRIGDVLLKRN